MEVFSRTGTPTSKEYSQEKSFKFLVHKTSALIHVGLLQVFSSIKGTIYSTFIITLKPHHELGNFSFQNVTGLFVFLSRFERRIGFIECHFFVWSLRIITASFFSLSRL